MIEFFKNHEFFWFAVSALVVAGFVVWAIVYYLFYAIRSQFSGRTIWNGSTNNQTVALTFDDGPTPETLEILDCLGAANLKATFFLIGSQVEKYPHIARRIAHEGHEIGNHSYSHPIFLFRMPKKTRTELADTQKIIKATTGVTPKIARPPCGVRSPAYFSAAKNLGLQTVQWSDAGFDWKMFSAEEIAGKILDTVQSRSIILLHDGDSAQKNRRRATVEAVPLILRGLREKGLKVVPLAELCPEISETTFDTKLFFQSQKGETQV